MEVIFLEPRDLEPREYFEKQLDRTDKWLSFAEAKNAALVALSLAMSGVIVKWIGNPGTDSLRTRNFLTLDLWLFIISLLIALFSFYPNLSKTPQINSDSKKKDSNFNLAFYGDIQSFSSAEEYISCFCSQYKYPLFKVMKRPFINLANEIIINSQITAKKYKLFKYALGLDAFAFILFLCIILNNSSLQLLNH